MATNAPDYTPIYQAAGNEWNVDPRLLQAVAGQEGGGVSNVSSAGAMGHMQIMPGTAKELGVTNPNDVTQSVYGGAKYLSQMLDRYGTPELALSAYNAGPGRVDQHLASNGTVPLPAETQAYVPGVTRRYQAIARADQPVPAPQPAAAPQRAPASLVAPPMGDDPFSKALADAPADAAPASSVAPPLGDDPFSKALAPVAVAPGPVPFSDGQGGTLPDGSATRDPAVWARWTQGFQQSTPTEPSTLDKIGAGLGRAAHDLTDGPAELLARGADALGLTSGQGAQTTTGDQSALQTYGQQYGDSAIAGTARVAGQIAGMVPVLASGGALVGSAGRVLAAGAGRLAPMIGTAVEGGNALIGGTLPGNALVRGSSLAINGAIQGAAAGALTSGQSSEPLGDQVYNGLRAGAVIGPVAGAVGAGVRGTFNALTGLGGGATPEVAALAQTARDTYKIPLTAPQISQNSLVRIANDQSSKLPFSGAGAVHEAQQTAFNRAVAGTFGETADRITPEVMDRAATRIGGVFDNIAGRTSIQADPQFMGALNRISADAAQVLPASEQAPINAQITNLVDAAQKGNGTISGDAYQALTRANTPLGRAMKSADPNVQFYARQVRDTLDDAFQRSAAPADQAALGQARGQYRSMKTIEDLAEKSTDGNISAPLLMGQVRNASSRFDSSNGGMAYTGGGPLGDLARIGQQFMKAQPNSGTPDRMLINGLMLGQGGLGAAAYMGGVHPLAAAVPIAGLAANRLAGNYLRSGFYANNVINSSLNPGNQLVGRVLGQAVPYAAPVGAARYNALAQTPPVNPLTGR